MSKKKTIDYSKIKISMLGLKAANIQIEKFNNPEFIINLFRLRKKNYDEATPNIVEKLDEVKFIEKNLINFDNLDKENISILNAELVKYLKGGGFNEALLFIFKEFRILNMEKLNSTRIKKSNQKKEILSRLNKVINDKYPKGKKRMGVRSVIEEFFWDLKLEEKELWLTNEELKNNPILEKYEKEKKETSSLVEKVVEKIYKNHSKYEKELTSGPQRLKKYEKELTSGTQSSKKIDHNVQIFTTEKSERSSPPRSNLNMFFDFMKDMTEKQSPPKYQLAGAGLAAVTTALFVCLQAK